MIRGLGVGSPAVFIFDAVVFCVVCVSVTVCFATWRGVFCHMCFPKRARPGVFRFFFGFRVIFFAGKLGCSAGCSYLCIRFRLRNGVFPLRAWRGSFFERFS